MVIQDWRKACKAVITNPRHGAELVVAIREELDRAHYCKVDTQYLREKIGDLQRFVGDVELGQERLSAAAREEADSCEP